MRVNETIIGKDAVKFSWKSRLKSFVHAWSGIILFFRTEHNAQIHLTATILVIMLSMFFKINHSEVIAIGFSIALVWITEMINTVIEKTMDFISVEKNSRIKIIKDMAAGAVLVAVIAALVTGSIIFIPKFMAL